MAIRKTNKFDIYWELPNGNLHRINGPAKIGYYGYIAWCLNGDYYRENGPARIWNDGSKRWYQNCKLHREDGPAVISRYGAPTWCSNGDHLRSDWHMCIQQNGTKRWSPDCKLQMKFGFRYDRHYDNYNFWILNHHEYHPHNYTNRSKTKRWSL